MYIMKLQEQPFEQIKSGLKKWEIRLNDEKRKNIKIGDSILFRKLPDLLSGIVVEVEDVKYFSSFRKMAETISIIDIGFDKNSKIEDVESCYRKYYSEDEEKKYGVVAFKIKVIK